MRKSKLLTVLTVATMAVTMTLQTALPKDIFVTRVMAQEGIKEGRCGDDATFCYDTKTKTLTVSGTGEMWDDAGFAKSLKDTKNIVIEKGITSIGSSSFYGLEKVKNVVIADTVKTIKNEAFGDIKGTITIPTSVNKVETCAIFGAKKIIIKGDMKNYQYAAFEGGAEQIEIGGTADTLGYALANIFEAHNNVSITIAKNNRKCKVLNGCLMSSDGKKVYYYVSRKKKVVIPDSAVTIKAAAFYKKNIREVKLGKNVKKVEEYAFDDSKIKKLVTNKKLKSIGRYGFSCMDLECVTLKSNVTMGSRAFESYVNIKTTKNFKKAKTVLSNPTIENKWMDIPFCEVDGAQGYQVQIKKGRKIYKYTTDKTDFYMKAPKAFRNTYNVVYEYDISGYSGKVVGEPAYIKVRPYKISKNSEKIYGKWSSKTILSKWVE